MHSPHAPVERQWVFDDLIDYTISLSPGNESARFEVGDNVVLRIGTFEDDRERDSSNVQTKTIMDYKGEVQELRGRILTAYKDLVAFRCYNEKTGETVRIIDLSTRNRHQLKDLEHRPVDMAFAQNSPLLAILDAESSLYIYKIGEGFNVERFLSVTNWPSRSTRDATERLRITWCPYVPDASDDDNQDEWHMLAVYSGRHVSILSLTLLKESSPDGEIDFDQAKNVADAVYSVTVDEDNDHDVYVKGVYISPDATAVAIIKSSGLVSFYVMDDDGLKFAHNWDPKFGSPVTDIVFLDDLRPERNDLPFWGTCLAIADGGKKVALYECQTWKCLGRIRFEVASDNTEFAPYFDVSTRFVHFLDVDRSSIYSIELATVDGLPRFAGVTQTSFFRSVYAFAPLNSSTFDNADQSFDDMFGNESEGKEARSSLCALTSRSLVEMQIQLEVHDAPSGKNEKIGGSVLSPNVFDVGNARSAGPSELFKSTRNVKNTRSDSPLIQEQNNAELEKKLDLVLERLDLLENANSRGNDSSDQIVTMLNNLAEEGRQREDLLLSTIGRTMENLRTDLMTSLDRGLTENRRHVEASMVAIHQKNFELQSKVLGGQFKQAFAETVVPSLERTCTQLFDRLNDSFQNGLNEYLKSMKLALQNAALTLNSVNPPPSVAIANERFAIMQLVNTNPALAFETALNKGDPTLLEFVCSHVNPDALFAQPNCMSQPVLVSLLQQLTITLSHERDLKYRYIEHILGAIQPTDADTSSVVPNVLSQLLASLKEIASRTTDSMVLRQTRLIYQLAQSIGFQSPLPTHITSLPPDTHNII
ncbi:unnamed protein product [Caenorhabditis auriculariae]|uniref:Enhancer of mRNA-decapping protein 4 WD40 repeat region domain-containing protein n=1 Tax=Caenorhabditis auriculariae TaxID=2777116 RepID=A0A8S1H8H5_9PELO|nr:unnamed protein product [Caenorhabditis auriculariae]